MYQSWLAGKNLIVYGRGGFGKSEMTYHFFDLLEQVDKDYSADLLDCGGADSTKIWAGIKGEELPNFIYNVEASWLASKYVVFEELFDAQLGALVEMKQTLTSKEFRTPLQRYTSRCEWLVCLTNKSKSEVLDSVSEESRNTVDALLQRFPLSYQLEWTSDQLRDPASWVSLLQKGNWDIARPVADLFAAAVAECHKQRKSGDDYMSPRSALHLLGTTKAWATTCGGQLDLKHFISTAWAYPAPAAVYFNDQEWAWQEIIPIPLPTLPTVDEFDDMATNLDVTALHVDVLALQSIAARIYEEYKDTADDDTRFQLDMLSRVLHRSLARWQAHNGITLEVAA
jgi:hypothetical protein